MKPGIHISLRPGERIYINGAVLRVDRKVSIEFLNDVTFLLESHVIQAEQATTPLRQLYFIVQTMLIDPASAASARALFDQAFPMSLALAADGQVAARLRTAHDLIAGDKIFEALKTIRSLFPLEGGTSSAKGSAHSNAGNQQIKVAACK